MPYLIDASNLGGLLGGASGARDARAVLAFLAPWARERGAVVVVFDGPEQSALARRYGPVEVAWSGADRAAAIRARISLGWKPSVASSRNAGASKVLGCRAEVRYR